MHGSVTLDISMEELSTINCDQVMITSVLPVNNDSDYRF